MAFLNVTVTSSSSYQWYIGGLSSPFNTSNYIRAGIFNQPFPNGSYQNSTPPGLISNVYAPSSGSSSSTPTTTVFGSVSGGNTYTGYGGMQAANGTWYVAGSVTFTVPAIVTGLFKVSATPNSITIAWNTSLGATGYHMYRNNAYVTSVSGTSFTHTGLAANTQYSLGVIPYNSSGQGTGQSILASTISNRPSNFFWDNTKVTDGNFNMTANEWNRLTNSINQFRVYNSLPPYNFVYNASTFPGDPFTANRWNEIISSFAGLNYTSSPPPFRQVGEVISANHVNRIRDSLNSIP